MNKEIKLAQLMEFFIKKYSYGLVKFQDPSLVNKKEFWLVKPDHYKYQLIRITTNSLEIRDYEKEKLNNIVQSIGVSLNREINFLDLHLTDEEVLENDDIDTVCINGDQISGVDIKILYPEILKVLDDKNNNDKSVNDVNQRVEKFIKNKIVESKKKKNPYLDKQYIGTNLITLLCVLVYVATNVVNLFVDNIIVADIITGAYYKTFIMGLGQYWRFLTAGFLHGNIFHLIMNLYALSILGRSVERQYGTLNFFKVLIPSMIGGLIFVYILDANNVTLGISAGLYGLMATIIVYLFDTGLIKNKRVRNGIIFQLLLCVVISITPGVSMYGHLGGFMIGLLISLTFIKNSNYRDLVRNSYFALIIALGLMIYFTVVEKDYKPLYGQTDIDVIEGYQKLGLNDYSNKLTIDLNEYYYKIGVLK